MKKTLLGVFALALIAGTASAADLIADGGDGIGIDVGEVTITNDATNLIVTITLIDPLIEGMVDWELIESHVHAAETVAAIPQTKKGNARPGRFDYCELDPEATSVSPTEHVYTIPLDAIGDEGVELGDAIVVAVHTAIEYVEIVGEPDDIDDSEPDIVHDPTGWGKGPEISEGRDWAMYIEFTLPDPDLIVSEIILVSDEIYSGDILGYTYTVENIGGEGPEGISVFDVASYLSTDAVLDGSDTELVSGYSAWSYHLDVGWSASYTESDVVITAAPGPYYLIVVADAKPGEAPNFYPGVVESNEDNNTQAIAFTVLAAP